MFLLVNLYFVLQFDNIYSTYPSSQKMPTCFLNVDFLIGLKLAIINMNYNVLFIHLYF